MLLEVNNVSKSFGGNIIISDISLRVEDRERVGLIGVNGAGKSTILKIITGELICDEGYVLAAKNINIGYMEQNGMQSSYNTLWEEMLGVFSGLIKIEKELRILEQQMGMDDILKNESTYKKVMDEYATKSELFEKQGGYIIEAKIKNILNGMGFQNFSYDTEVSKLSGGEKTRLSLSKLLLLEPDLLILDEPTNHLDITTLEWLENYLKSYPGAIIIVSHDRYFLDSIVTTIYELERGKIKRYSGNYSSYTDTKAKNKQIQTKHYVLQQRQIVKMEDYINRHIVRATSSKSAKNKRMALDHLVRVDKPESELKNAMFLFKMESPSYRDVLSVINISLSVGEGQNRKKLLNNICFDLKSGDKAALLGANGIGKSTLFKALSGIYNADSGEIIWGRNVKLSYYEQEQSSLNPYKTVLGEIWDRFPKAEETRIRTVLGNVLLTGESVYKKVSELSGGEKAHLALAIIIMEKSNVLILDEPTNHLDLSSKEILEKALTDYPGTILFVSHDRYFINRIASTILELTPEGINRYEGNYDSYIQRKYTGAEQVITLQQNKIKKQQKKDAINLQQKRSDIESMIMMLEEEIPYLEKELDDPGLYKDYGLFQQKYKTITDKKSLLKQYYNKWEDTLS